MSFQLNVAPDEFLLQPVDVAVADFLLALGLPQAYGLQGLPQVAGLEQGVLA